MVGNIKTLHTHVNVDNINNRWVLLVLIKSVFTSFLEETSLLRQT